MRKLSKITEGILGDIARRDLSGRKRNENLLRPHTRNEFREIVKDEIRKQGGVDIDLRHIFLPENMTSLSFLFEDYDKIESLDLTGWDMTDVRTFTGMFDGCTNLKSIRGIEDWNVNDAYNFYEMFNECRSLETIDLSGWKIDFEHPFLVVDGMFAGCRNLKLIKGMIHWILSQKELQEIGRGCPGIHRIFGRG